MRGLRSVFLLIMMGCVAVSAIAADEKAVFGPVKYDVKERYGKLNRFTVTFPASEALYLMKIQNGEKRAESADLIELAVNGVKVLRNDQYPHPFMAYFVKLKKENTFELLLRDHTPPGFRRPPALPKNVIITVQTVSAGMKNLNGIFGLNTWESLKEFSEGIQKINKPEAATLAMTALSLQNEMTARTDAMRKLSDMKEQSAREYLLMTYNDFSCAVEVRAEAALAIALVGDKKDIPLLMHGIVDPDEKISISASRALSFYPEADTEDLLIKTLESIDNLRKPSIIKNLIAAGWKPVGALIKMADSPDKHVAGIALNILGGLNDKRATDYLLATIDNPGTRDIRGHIYALGETKDPRTLERLLALAADPVKRKGNEIELGEALAKSGDQRAVAPIVDMIKTAPSNNAKNRLKADYKNLTGKDY